MEKMKVKNENEIYSESAKRLTHNTHWLKYIEYNRNY